MVKAAAEAEEQLVMPLFQFRNYGQQLPHNWSTISNEAAFGTDYFTRTAVAKSNILDAAAASAYQMSRVLATKSEINGVNYKVYPDRQWINPMASGNPFDMAWNRPTTGILALDARTNFFTNYYSWSPGMVSQTPGKGANYMVANFDSKGVPLSGSKNYKVTLPRTFPRRTSGQSRFTTRSTHPAWTTASRSRRSARATSPQKTPTAALICTSAPRRHRAKRRTGLP